MTSFLLEYQKLQGAVFFLLKWLFRDVGELLDEKLHPRDDHHSIEKNIMSNGIFLSVLCLDHLFCKVLWIFFNSNNTQRCPLLPYIDCP
mmetsp:Transcript_6425/g.13153  ORF Transcript_6425/g.13153 Transcript_6425/m.13153 type:complete len:89 (+) Transcript_6425:173-439(+)